MNAKLKKIVTLMISFGIIVSLIAVIDINSAKAKEGDQNLYAKSELADTAIFTMIDENGHVVEMDDDEVNESGMIKPSSSKFRMARTVVSDNDVLIQKGVVNFRTKDVYTNTNFKEDVTGRSGYTNGHYAADAAYLGHNASRTKVKFMLAGVIGWVNADEVQVLDFSSSQVQTISKYFVNNGRLYHGIVSNLKNTSYSNKLDCGPKPSYLREGEEYYSYDGHYFYSYNNTKGYTTMLSDYRNDTRKNAVNANNPYYNYYQYIPQRSKSIYTAEQLNKAIDHFSANAEKSSGRSSKMRGLGQSFIDNQNKYGVNAMTTIGIAANESAWGTSKIANNKNNLFGHNAYDSDPAGSSNSYSTPAFSIYYHTSTFMSKHYSNPLNWKYHGNFLGDKASGACLKYASDPYWAEKAAAFAWRIDSYLGGKDSFRYTIGIKNKYNFNYSVSPIVSDASSRGKTLYKNEKDGGLSNYAFIILDDNKINNYYKIQSDGIINSSRSGLVTNDIYDFNSNYAYIAYDNNMIVIKGNHKDVVTYKKGDINCDNKINSSDLLKLEKYIVFGNKLNDLQLDLADVNNDGKVNTSDLLKLEKYIVFNIPF